MWYNYYTIFHKRRLESILKQQRDKLFQTKVVTVTLFAHCTYNIFLEYELPILQLMSCQYKTYCLTAGESGEHLQSLEKYICAGSHSALFRIHLRPHKPLLARSCALIQENLSSLYFTEHFESPQQMWDIFSGILKSKKNRL